jgi:hypothetical protein
MHNHSFIHSDVCLTKGPQILPKRVFHRGRPSASSFNFQYPLFSLRSSSSCLRLRPRFLAISVLPNIFPSITCFRRQFQCKMRPIQLAFLLFIVCGIFLSSFTLYKACFFSHVIGRTDLLHPSPAPRFKMFQVFLMH